MLKLISSNSAIAEGISLVFKTRELQRNFAPRTSISELRSLASDVESIQLKAGEVLYQEEILNKYFIS